MRYTSSMRDLQNIRRHRMGRILASPATERFAGIERSSRARIDALKPRAFAVYSRFQRRSIKNVTFSPEFESLSRWVGQLQAVIAQFGYSDTYIGGSSTREILDHVFLGAPLQLRDLDIYLIRGQPVEVHDVSSLATEIQKRGLAVLGEETIRQKLRANPKLDRPDCFKYTIGLGAHMFAENQPILSLGVIHSRADLDLNGLFNFDRIYLNLAGQQSLAEFATNLLGAGHTTHTVGLSPSIYDPSDGYRAWIRRTPKIINWLEVERIGAKSSLRLVRSFTRAGLLSLPRDFVNDFGNIMLEPTKIDSSREYLRGVVKIFGDYHWAHELEMLATIQTFRDWSIDFQVYLETQSAQKLAAHVPDLIGSQSKLDLALARIHGVLNHYPHQDREILRKQLVEVAPSVFGGH